MDLLFINEHKYTEKDIPETIITIFYEPSRHRLFLDIIPNKKPESIVISFKNFMGYSGLLLD
jgi:hypothetical protein